MQISPKTFIHDCSYNPGQKLLRQKTAGKNWNLRQMNARFTPSPYPKLFRIEWQLYMYIRQLWIGGGEGAYFLSLEETGVERKS